MKLVLAQFDTIWEDNNANKVKVSKFLEEAKSKDADLILFPEMTLTGFSMNVSSIEETKNHAGSTLQWFQLMGSKYKLYIGFGYVEKPSSNGKAKNNFAIISPQGELLCDYSKIHPFSFGEESHYYEGGNKIFISKINEFLVAPFICYDLRFPEIFQIASKQATLITISANWPTARKDHWISLLKARAIENQCYIAGINRTGIGNNIQYFGNSMIIDPFGNIIVQGDECEGLIIEDIDVGEAYRLREAFNLKKDRKEDLYKILNPTIMPYKK